MYLNEEESQVVCCQLVESLTLEEQESAARTSYVYWHAATYGGEPPSDELRLKMAMREAQRHTVGPHGYDRALEALKATCAFRKDRKLELFRTLFDEYPPQYGNEEEKELANEYQAHIRHDLSKQKVVVRGMDKESRAIIIVFPRTCPEAISEDCFINTQLYMIERAIACTEVLSEGREDQIVVVLDFGSLKSSCNPPVKSVRELIWILQNHYPQRLRNLVIVNAPLWMRGFYSVLSPFVDSYTKTKFRIAKKGDKQAIQDIIDSDQAMPFLLPNGKLCAHVDTDHFIHNVPFQCLYDEAV